MSSHSNGSSVSEGKVTIEFDGDASVFYNPVQEFNRDLSIFVIRQYVLDRNVASDSDSSDGTPKSKRRKTVEEKVHILEALSATGLRAIRYAKEIAGVTSIVANDVSVKAVECIQQNVEANGVQSVVIPTNADAVDLMNSYRKGGEKAPFTIVDLDPYGSPVQFLDSAVRCIEDGGLLMVTSTDMAVLCGNTPEACFAKYGSTAIRTKFCHEFAIRLLLRAIEARANVYGRCVEPLLSLSIDFYIRVFVRVRIGQSRVKDSICSCHSFTLQPLAKKLEEGSSLKYCVAKAPVIGERCDICNGTYRITGPIWSNPIHDFEFLKRLLKAAENCPEDQTVGTLKRIIGMLNVVLEELPDVPLYQALDGMCAVVKASTPKITVFRSALLHAGYRVSSSHASPQVLKTDAPNDVIWDIVRCWAKDSKVKLEKFAEDSAAYFILNKAPSIQANFALRHDAIPPAPSIPGVSRFPKNPKKFWGPKARAKTVRNTS